MTRCITITSGEVAVTARLVESETAELVWDALPLEATVSTWGDEIYFRTPVRAEEEDSGTWG